MDNEEESSDYAEMLEIPVRTLNVIRKKGKKRTADEKDDVIGAVNERVNTGEYDTAASEVITTKPKRGAAIALTVEFAVACALCAVIFLTNIFMQNSAINAFMGGLFHKTAGETVDNRGYAEVALSSPVSELAGDVEVTVSANGIISFTAACSVYPMANGKVTAVEKTEEGYNLSIAYTTTFSTVIGGLDTVYAAVGDEVPANLPVGRTNGEREVRVMLYSEGVLLHNYTFADNNFTWQV